MEIASLGREVGTMPSSMSDQEGYCAWGTGNASANESNGGRGLMGGQEGVGWRGVARRRRWRHALSSVRGLMSWGGGLAAVTPRRGGGSLCRVS